MSRLIGLALLALAGVTNFGGGHGTDSRSNEAHGGRNLDRGLSDMPVVRQLDLSGSSGGVGSTAHGYSLRIHNLSADGIATPEPVATASVVSGVTPIPTPEPTQDAPVFGAGVEQWRSLVASVFPGQVNSVLRRIGCESGGNPNAVGLEGERGLLQIHPVHHDSTYDPLGNLLAAYRISNGGTDWSAWSCR